MTQTIADNLQIIRDEIKKLATAAGRDAGAVRLIAVSKTKPVEDVQAAYAAGQRDFGENYPQELKDKYPVLPEDIRWHFIGHLQTNKVKYIAPFVAVIHTVDSVRLIEEIEKQAAKYDRIIDCLIQVHISGEETKFGALPEEVGDLLKYAAGCPHVRMTGLMGMAALTEDTELIQRQFAGLQALRDQWQQEYPLLTELSMGMSSDMAEAIAEGATWVRVGSAIFGQRSYLNR